MNHYTVITVGGKSQGATFPKPDCLTDKDKRILSYRLAEYKKANPGMTVKIVERKEREIIL